MRAGDIAAWLSPAAMLVLRQAQRLRDLRRLPLPGAERCVRLGFRLLLGVGCKALPVVVSREWLWWHRWLDSPRVVTAAVATGAAAGVIVVVLVATRLRRQVSHSRSLPITSMLTCERNVSC